MDEEAQRYVLAKNLQDELRSDLPRFEIEVYYTPEIIIEETCLPAQFILRWGLQVGGDRLICVHGYAPNLLEDSDIPIKDIIKGGVLEEIARALSLP